MQAESLIWSRRAPATLATHGRLGAHDGVRCLRHETIRKRHKRGVCFNEMSLVDSTDAWVRMTACG